MAKAPKLSTPAWILEGYDSPAEYEKAHAGKAGGKTKEKSSSKKSGKTYTIKVCPKCGSDEVGVVLKGEEGKKADEWECRSCGWKGKNIDEKELNEDEFLELMERK